MPTWNERGLKKGKDAAANWILALSTSAGLRSVSSSSPLDGGSPWDYFTGGATFRHYPHKKIAEAIVTLTVRAARVRAQGGQLLGLCRAADPYT